ncbi:MAG: InlB B-repeat-containing protein, partial [Solirubrobacterales bacterium]
SRLIIQAAIRPAGQSSFGAPQDLSLGGQNAGLPQVAVSPSGSAVAVWTRNDGTGKNVIQAAVRPAGQASFDPAQTISETGQFATRPQVAVAPDGSATAVWQRQNDGSTYTVQSATRPAGVASSFGTPQNLSLPEAGRNANVPQVAVAPNGSVTAVWERYDGSKSVIQSATRPAGQATFEPAENRSQADENAFEPQVATGADGSTTIVWRRFDGLGYIPQTITRQSGQTVFGPVEDLAPVNENASGPQLGVAPDGAVTVVWASAGIIRTATRPAGEAAYTSPVDLSLGGQAAARPQVAVGLDGAATAVWERSNGSESIVQGTGSSATSYQLAVQSQGPGTVSSSPTGISCGPSCTASFPLSRSVTLTATPTSGASLSSWGGACSGSSTTCTVPVLGNRSVTATFVEGPPPTVTVMAPKAKVTRNSILLTSKVKVSGAGKIAQRTTTGKGKKTKTWCRASKNVGKAGTYTLKCNLGKKGRSALRKGALKLTLRTTFTPTTSKAVTVNRKLTVKRKR